MQNAAKTFFTCEILNLHLNLTFLYASALQKYVRGIIPKEEDSGISLSKKNTIRINFFCLQSIESAIQLPLY